MKIFGYKLVKSEEEDKNVTVTETENKEEKEMAKEMKKSGKGKKVLGAALGAGAAIGAVAFALLRHSGDPESEFEDAEIVGNDDSDAGEVSEADFTEE